MVIDVVDLNEEDGTATMFTSPLTEPSSSSSSSQLRCWSAIAAPLVDKQDKENCLEGSNQQLHKHPPAAQHNNTTKPRKKARRSSRQASVARLEAKRENTAYNR